MTWIYCLCPFEKYPYVKKLISLLLENEYSYNKRVFYLAQYYVLKKKNLPDIVCKANVTFNIIFQQQVSINTLNADSDQIKLCIHFLRLVMDNWSRSYLNQWVTASCFTKCWKWFYFVIVEGRNKGISMLMSKYSSNMCPNVRPKLILSFFFQIMEYIILVILVISFIHFHTW